MYTDPIADYLTRIRNAIMAAHRRVDIPYSNFKKSITEVLQDKGFIKGYRVIDSVDNAPQKTLQIALKYNPANKQNAIVSLQRISKPGLRNYVSASKLPRVLNGLGIAVVSTSQGVISDKEARQKGIGGEIVCYVY